ncbi:MAG: YqaJ viral recombinase family protein [Acidobacteriota bacterium]
MFGNGNGNAVATAAMDDAAWLAARRKVLTATDSPAILGLHPTKSAFQVFVEKTEGVELTPMDERMRWGQRHEPTIAAAYQEETGRQVLPPRERLSLHATIPWLGASLDRLVVDAERGPGVLELKTTAKDVSRELPVHWQVQVAHQMEVAGVAWGSIAVLIAGSRMLWFDLDRSDRFLRGLLRKLECFWKHHVQARVPPPIDGSESCARALAAYYAAASEQSVDLPPESAEWAREYLTAQGELRIWEARKTKAQNAICAALGAATVGTAVDGTRFSWRPNARGGRVFRVMGQGGAR